MKLGWVCTVFFMIASSSSWAAEVVVFPVQATNLTPVQADAMGAVLAQQYAKVSGKDVLAPAQAGAALKEGMSLAAAAKVLGASEYIEVKAIALDAKILIDTTRRDRTGGMVARAQMTALSLDDMIEVGDRLSRALVEKKTPDQTLNLDNVTRNEGSPRNKTRSSKTLGVKTALAFPVFSGRFNPIGILGFDGRYEGDSFFLEFGVGAMIPNDSSNNRKNYGGLYSEIGGSYFLTNTTVAPYIGAGVIPRILLGDVGGINIAPYGQLGVMLLRASSTRLYTDVRVATNVLPVRVKSGDFNSEQVSYYPTEITWQVGIGW